MIKKICFYCSENADTRPYGPGGSQVCLPCINNDPKRSEAARAAFNVQLEAALGAAADGLVILDAETGDLKIMSREELKQYGGLPDEH